MEAVAKLNEGLDCSAGAGNDALRLPLVAESRREAGLDDSLFRK